MAKAKPMPEHDRAIRDLVKGLEGLDDNQRISLTVRHLRSLIFKLYEDKSGLSKDEILAMTFFAQRRTGDK